MNRLFKDCGCEVPNDLGRDVGDEIRKLLKPLVKDAVDCKMSLRDFQTIVFEEISLLCAEERLRLGLKERAEARKKKAMECGCPGVCSETDGNPAESDS